MLIDNGFSALPCWIAACPLAYQLRLTYFFCQYFSGFTVIRLCPHFCCFNLAMFFWLLYERESCKYNPKKYHGGSYNYERALRLYYRKEDNISHDHLFVHCVLYVQNSNDRYLHQIF